MGCQENERVATLQEAIEIFSRNANVLKESEDARTLMYRGQADATFNLSPSIFRKNGLIHEARMIRELKRLAPAEFGYNESALDQLIKMQHYGLPTRLLDITSNPLVALYFACADDSCLDKDGEVITFYDYFTPYDSLDVKRYAELSTYEGSTHQDLKKFTSSNDPFEDSEKKVLIDNIKRYFDARYFLISVPLNNERIRRQHGGFLLFGMDVEQQTNPFQKEAFDIKNEVIQSRDSDEICRSIIIPADAKKDMLQMLDAVGINRSFLFPEFEHQAGYVKQKFLDEGEEEAV